MSNVFLLKSPYYHCKYPCELFSPNISILYPVLIILSSIRKNMEIHSNPNMFKILKFRAFPWLSHGFSMGFPWLSHGFPMGFPMIFPRHWRFPSFTSGASEPMRRTARCAHRSWAMARWSVGRRLTKRLGDGDVGFFHRAKNMGKIHGKKYII